MCKKISIIGAGSWGTALAILLAENHAAIQMWGHNPIVVEELIHQRTNSTYLPGLCLPSNVSVTDQLVDVLDAECILIVIPSKAIRQVASEIEKLGVSPESIFISCTKGIEHESSLLMSEILGNYFPRNPLAVLSGPNHAIEVAQRIPAAAVIGAKDPKILEKLHKIFFLPTFRVYTSSDIRGIQLGGALKNVFAIAAGASDGFKMGDNAKAGLVTRALAEMTRLGIALGGERETFYGLSGIGDLMVTCFSRHSRNRSFGEKLGQGQSPITIQNSMKMVAEGVPTTKSAWHLAHKLGIDAPLIETVYQVIYEGKTPHDALWELLGRRPRTEPEFNQNATFKKN